MIWGATGESGVISTVGGGGTTTLLANRKWFDNATAVTATQDTSFYPPGCAASFKFSGAGTASQNFQAAFSDQTYTVGCWFARGAGTPSSAQRFTYGATNTNGLRLSTTNTIQTIAGGGQATDLYTAKPNVWYWCSAAIDSSGTAWTVKGSVYDTSGRLLGQGTSTLGTAAVTETAMLFGMNTAAGGVDMWIASPVIYDSTADHPLPRHAATLLVPAACGVHSFTSGDFQDESSVNLGTAEATSYSKLVEKPPDTTAFVKQVTSSGTASYLEYSFAPISRANFGTPVFVQLKAAMHPVGAQTANTVGFRLNDGGTVTAEAILDTSIATNTLEYRMHGYQVRPNGGGSWDTTSVNALRVRYGYSNDGTPPPALDAVYLEAFAPVTGYSANSLTVVQA